MKTCATCKWWRAFDWFPSNGRCTLTLPPQYLLQEDAMADVTRKDDGCSLHLPHVDDAR